MPDEMFAEFGRLALWTADAVEDLGVEAVGPACQGSGPPAGLDWLIRGLRMGQATRFVDIGAGLGGPAEYAARAVGVVPFLLDPVAEACRAASRLFAHRVLVADGAALPLAGDSVDVAWSLGVLCTVEDKRSHIEEIARILGPGGGLGLLVYERATAYLPEHPQGNHFPRAEDVDRLLTRSGLEIECTVGLDELEPAPGEWVRASEAVDEYMCRRHGHESPWRRANDQVQLFRMLTERGLVAGRLVVARKSPAPEPTRVSGMCTKARVHEP